MAHDIAHDQTVVARTDEQAKNLQTQIVAKGGKGAGFGGCSRHAGKHTDKAGFVNMIVQSMMSGK